jgi:hypothetical protein
MQEFAAGCVARFAFESPATDLPYGGAAGGG